MSITITEVAIGINLILDIIDRVKTRTGVEITPENIGDYIAQREARRAELNAELGITPDAADTASETSGE